ncbi:MAG: hypothetical protein MPN21_27750 [Thermoanaerobaculia bacterium]|nr:hypothetical protein [Thermoanaerobaculia bacterium]
MRAVTSLRWINLTLLMFSLAAAAGAQSTHDRPQAEPIVHFGATGDRVPDAARDLLPATFFSQDLIRAVADPANYSAVLDLGEMVATTGADRRGGRRVILILENRATRDNDVVIAAPGLGDQDGRNFLVRVEALGERRIDLSRLADVPSVYLLSLQNFVARAEVRGPNGAKRSKELSTSPSSGSGLAGGKSGGGSCGEQKSYCAACTEDIELENANGSVYARAVRTFWYTASSGHDYYQINVQYPIGGPIFHCQYSTYASGTECKASEFITYRPSTPGVCSVGTATAQHDWDGLDDTLFFGFPSTVTCMSGCTDTWTVNLY